MVPFSLQRIVTVGDAVASGASHPADDWPGLADYLAGGTDLMQLMKEQVRNPSRIVNVGGLYDHAAVARASNSATAHCPKKEHGGSTTTASVGSAVQAACEDVLAEVRVDLDFGTVRATRILGAYDAGRIVNPKLAHSQCIGGMVGGIGMALLEEADWDERLGRVTNATIAEYLVPVNADVIDLDAVFVPGEDPVINPIGVKGLAELGLCGVAPAIANAVWNATGVRVRDLPITPDKLLRG